MGLRCGLICSFEGFLWLMREEGGKKRQRTIRVPEEKSAVREEGGGERVLRRKCRQGRGSWVGIQESQGSKPCFHGYSS